MTTTIGALIDRLYRDYLHPPDETPHQAILTGAVVAGDGTIPVDTSPLTDMVAELGPGITVEVGQERMLVTGWDAATSTFTVDRPNPTTHNPGARVLIAPHWSRASVFEAVADTIVELWPDLYAVKSTYMSPGSQGVLPAPEDMRGLVGFSQGDVAWRSHHHLYLAGSNGVIAFDSAIYPGGWLTYKAAFIRPASEATTLAECNVTEEWRRLIIVGALTQLLAGRDLPNTTIEFITKALEAQAVQIGTYVSLRDSLHGYYNRLLRQAQDRQLAVDAPTVTHADVVRNEW